MHRTKIKRFISGTVFLLAILSFPAKGQTVGNVTVQVFGDTLNVNYDITGGKPDNLYKIDMTVSSDGGHSFSNIAKSAKGDIGYGVTQGLNKLIVWSPLLDSVELAGSNFIFKIIAKVYGNPREVEFVSIKGGSYQMGNYLKDGSADENFVHKVSLDDFEISKYEVTNSQYAAFLNSYGKDVVASGEFKGEQMIYENEKGLKKLGTSWIPVVGYENYPVINVTWFGANEFCKFYGYRLPTEAEWEYAARERGKNVRYGNGRNDAEISEINFSKSKDENPTNTITIKTKHIASYMPNDLELFDMSGNVWEWCQDWYQSDYYSSSKTDNPTGPWFGRYKSIRGGSWYNTASEMRVTDRSFMVPYGKNGDIGFRPVRTISSMAEK